MLTQSELADYECICHSGKVRKQSELQVAFNLIAPKPNWKAAIFANVAADTDLLLLHDACVHFTGSIPSFDFEGNRWMVKAAGYYATIGS